MHILVRPGPDLCRVCGIQQAVDDQPIAVTARSIEVAAGRVDRNIVRRAAARLCHLSHDTVVDLTHVHDLNTRPPFTDNIGVILIHLDVVPEAVRATDDLNNLGIAGIGNFHECRTVGQSHQRILAARGGDVSPAVIACGGIAGETAQRQPTHERYTVAGKTQGAPSAARMSFQGSAEGAGLRCRMRHTGLWIIRMAHCRNDNGQACGCNHGSSQGDHQVPPLYPYASP